MGDTLSVPARRAAAAKGMLSSVARLRGESNPRCTKQACGTQETAVTCLGLGLGFGCGFGFGDARDLVRLRARVRRLGRVLQGSRDVESRHCAPPRRATVVEQPDLVAELREGARREG